MPTKSLLVRLGPATTLDYRQFVTNDKWQFYDRELFETSFYPSAGALVDINRDGRNEYIFSLTVYPFKKIPIAVLGFQDGIVDLTTTFMPNGAPTVGHPSFIHYVDINGDKNPDVVASEAGYDYPPWTGSRIGVAVATGLTFTDITTNIPQTTSRSYAIGVADFNNDGQLEILIPGQGSNEPDASYLLQINGTTVTKSDNPIANYLSEHLNSHTAIVTDDFNNDGYDDLLFSGAWVDRNNRLIYGSSNGFNTSNIIAMPAGPLGEEYIDYVESRLGPTSTRILSGPEVYSISLDVNNDGKNDIFSIGIQSTYYPPETYTGDPNGTNNNVTRDGGIVYGPTSFWLTKNVNGLNFLPTKTQDHNLGNIYYRGAFPFDINVDGYMDVIGHYWTIDNPKQYGTTFFLNNRGGSFTPTDASDSLGKR